MCAHDFGIKTSSDKRWKLGFLVVLDVFPPICQNPGSHFRARCFLKQQQQVYAMLIPTVAFSRNTVLM
jgi:hypothetical protein